MAKRLGTRARLLRSHILREAAKKGATPEQIRAWMLDPEKRGMINALAVIKVRDILTPKRARFRVKNG